jgi:putative heme-binding domain-containing protein
MACILLVGAFTPAVSAGSEIERWADQGLPVKDDLVLWLDAGRQAAARAAHGLPSSLVGGPVGTVFDGSGLHRDFGQRNGQAQPRLVVLPGRSILRFDGKDDCLERPGLNLRLQGATVFLVAAPASNLGGFHGFLAGNQSGVNDYVSGFTVDLGPEATTRFEWLNVEGKGFGGALNVLKEPRGFGEFHLLEVVVPAGPGSVTTFVDESPQSSRPRQGGVLLLDELTLGARCFSNEPRPVYLQGFLHGDIADVLIYGRALADLERRKVAEYLTAKHRGLTDALKAEATASGLRTLQTVTNPPLLQMLVPGFTVKELPLDLPNINNVRYRADGKLVALAYNGDVYLLSDRDGDGLEEHAERFWENKGRLRGPIGMALTPPGYARGNGLFVACKGKVSLIVDENSDDRADRELVVADGWKELPVAVDALGVAVGQDGSIYFGLGTGDYTNAYRVDDNGKAQYDLRQERGVIIKVAPDFRHREIVATGIRFPVGLAINRLGDLFATDQEGATWLSNGNPFDELLHIRSGRHYGFPPRHSRHLPGVIDEPSTFDYAPQHQSTCGLHFNDPAAGGKVHFGPPWWAGNAIVCGYSRGKLFRTELVRARGEYVARTSLIGVASMLTVDSCISPAGALVVAMHSGLPDWGTGPDGHGKLLKIVYSDRHLPQPVIAWSSGPRELRIALDRPLDPDHVRDLARDMTIEYGASVSAGDRFESLRPGYAVVAAQLAQPRRELRIQSVGLAPDRRTIILATDRQVEPVTYAVTLPGLGRIGQPDSAKNTVAQRAQIDLSLGLGGCAVSWNSEQGDASWTGWLPHPDLTVSRALTAQNAEHAALWPLLDQHGTLIVETQLKLKDLLRPAVQPGSVVDDQLPPEQATVLFRASRKLAVSSPVGTLESSTTSAGKQQAALRVSAHGGQLVPVKIVMETGRSASLEVDYHTNEDARLRALPLSRVLVPWARLESLPAEERLRALPEALKGGDWHRGRVVFQGAEALCSKCHTINGAGGKIGPDLSNLAERDLDSVLRDITQPSAAIHPDYISYSVALADGRVLSGPVRTEGSRLRVGTEKGEEIVIGKHEVEEMKPQGKSIMPEGLPKLLGPGRMKDLLAFLLTPPPVPAPIHRDDAPPARKQSELDCVLGPSGGVDPRTQSDRPLRIALVGGAKDHGIDEHDYPLWVERWSTLLGRADGVTVTAGWEWPSSIELAHADVVVLYSANPRWTAEKGRDLDAFLARGGGLVVIHYALNGNQAAPELAQRIGLAWVGGRSKFRHGPLDLKFPRSSPHPITTGFAALHLVDESYWALTGDIDQVNIIATGDEEGQAQPLLWTKEHAQGRVFCSVPGHYTWTFDDPLFRILILRGIAWAAHQRVDRFTALATLGARVESGTSGASSGPVR